MAPILAADPTNAARRSALVQRLEAAIDAAEEAEHFGLGDEEREAALAADIRAAETQIDLFETAERFAADVAPTLEAAGATEARLVGYWIYAFFPTRPNEAARTALKTMGFRFASQRSKDRDRGAASVWYWRPPSAPHTFRPRRSRALSMQEIEQRHGARAI